MTTAMFFPIPIHRITALLGMFFLLCLWALPVTAQEPQSGQANETAENQHWQPPDITSLPLTWWSGIETSSPEEFQQRMGQLRALVQEKFQGLNGEDFVEAQNLFAVLQGQVDLWVLALHGIEPVAFEPILTREAYTLDELLSLRGQWRDIEGQQQVPELRIEELQSQSSLLEQHRDDLLRQYDAVAVSAPARIILGLQRVSARLDYEINNRNLKYQEDRLEALRQQAQLLQDQQDFARARLVSGETDWNAIENEADAARTEAAAAADKMASLQRLLLEVLSASEQKPSLELLRKQQMTRAAASQSLAKVRDSLHVARANWYRFQSGTLDPGFDINASTQASGDLVEDAEDQAEVWTTASQTTLITPLPGSALNARKNVELAHSVAQETLEIIKKIENSSDDLALVQNILVSDMVEAQSVFKSLGTRLSLLSGDVWHVMQNVLDHEFFHIGDAPVTLGSIFSMFMILVFGFLLSWVIRHLLERLKNRRKYAKSSVVYTLGRILHYIIIISSVFIALGTIGLDFTNFALIAGALSVGIGFGLQSIVNNFVSGLILLFEGSLRVGDYIELDSGLRGTVREINTRATVINTNDSIDVVVPNSEFVTARLTNWTLRDPVARLRIDFGVAYGSDKEEVKAAALDAAAEVEYILQHTPGREAQVWLTNFGDSSLDFELLAWVSKAGVRRPQRTRAQFLWALETRLSERGIEIPFPQRDLHLRSGFEKRGQEERGQEERGQSSVPE
jgi:potassium efflux system protein